MVTGRVDMSKKALVEIVAAETVIEAEPELVALMVRVLLLPFATLPKPSDAAPMESVPVGGDVDEPALTPEQPVQSAIQASRHAAAANFSSRLHEIHLGAMADIVGNKPCVTQ